MVSWTVDVGDSCGGVLAFGAWLTGGDGGDEGGFGISVGVGSFRFRVLGFRWNCGLGDVVRVRGR